MIPIPKLLLIHSCTLETPLGEDGYGKVSYSDPVTLEHVRIDPSSSLSSDKQNRELRLSAVLIYDCRSSSGLNGNIEFQEEQRITFEGAQYTVNKISRLYDRLRLHHYEVELI